MADFNNIILVQVGLYHKQEIIMRARFVFFAVSALMLIAAACVQAQCIAVVSDQGCDVNHDCESTTNCTGTNFTVPVTGDYCLKIRTECSEEDDCKYCQACANVYDRSNIVNGSNCHMNPCEGCDQDCGGDCFELETGITYTLYVCLSPCQIGVNPRDCDDCPDDSQCKAYAALYKEGDLSKCDF